MLSSIVNNNKDLLNEWKDDRYKDYEEEDTSFFTAPNTTVTEHLVEKLNPAKNQAKREINLPKTKLTRKGQLYLYTNGKEAEDDDHDPSQLKSILNKNLIKKSYSQKWIDDVSQDFTLDPTKILDDKFDQNVTPKSSSITGKCGKNTEYFIHELKSKSGKDRYLQKASYLEFLPNDFNSKNQLADTLKSLTQTSNHERFIASRQTGNSAFSFLNDIVDYNSSDDERFEKSLSNRNELSTAVSRLSSQPVLSAKSLINRLNCTTNNGFLISTDTKNDEQNLEPRETKLDEHKVSGFGLTINYKDTFVLEDLATIENNLYQLEELNQSYMEQRNESVFSVRQNELNKFGIDYKKMLEKRHEKRVNNSPIVGFNSDNSETISLKSRNNSISTNKTRSILNKQSNLLSRSKRTTSPQQSIHNETTITSITDSTNLVEPLKVIGSKKKEDDENLPNLYNMRNQNSFYSSFVNNRNPTTPVPTYEKILIANNQAQKQQVYFRASNDDGDDNLEPITISVTEIENEATGNSIKIRRFFDRNAVRIKQIPINKDELRAPHSAKPRKTSNNLNNKLIDHGIDPNEFRKASSRRSSFKSNDNLSNFDSISNFVDFDNISDFKPVQEAAETKVTNTTPKVTAPKPPPARKISESLKAHIKTNLQNKKNSNDLRIKSAPNNKSTKSFSKNEMKKPTRGIKSANPVLSTSEPGSNEVKLKENQEQSNQEKLNEIKQEINQQDLGTENLNQNESFHDELNENIDEAKLAEILKEENEIDERKEEENNIEIIKSSEKNDMNYVESKSENEQDYFYTSSKVSSRKNSYHSVDYENLKLYNDDSADKQEYQELNTVETPLNHDKDNISPKTNENEVLVEQEEIQKEEFSVHLPISGQTHSFSEIATERENSQDLLNTNRTDNFTENEAGEYQTTEVVHHYRPVVDFVDEPQIIVISDNEDLVEEENQLENLEEEYPEDDDPNIIYQELANIESAEGEESEYYPSNNLVQEEQVPNLLEQILDNDLTEKRESNLSSLAESTDEAKKEQELQIVNKIEITDNYEYSSITKPAKKVEFSDKVMEQIISDVPTGDEKTINITNLNIKDEPEPTIYETSISNEQTKKVEIPTTIPEVPRKLSLSESSEPVKKSSEQINKPKKEEAKQDKSSVKSVKQAFKGKTSAKSKPEQKETKERTEEKSEPIFFEVQSGSSSTRIIEGISEFSRFDALLGVKDENKEEKKEKKEKPEKFFKDKHAAKKEKYKNFPYLQIPWDSKEPVVDQEAFNQTFQIPEVLCPELHNIDPYSTSIEELILERRILEDKILELRQEKLAILNMTSDERAKLQKKPEKKKTGKKSQKVEPKKNKDVEMKEKIIREERLRLHNEALRKQIERENIGNMMIQNIADKETEIENLTKELEKNTQEFNLQYQNVVDQINYLENTEDRVREELANARQQLREKVHKKQAEERKFMREIHEEKREQKIFDFSVKEKELEWLLSMYNDPEEVAKIKTKQTELEQEKENWFNKFENDCMDQERELDEKEEEEDNKFLIMEQEDEENSLKSIKQEQFEMLQEKKNLVENFEEIKLKITNRIQQIVEEKKLIENEKIQFDENTQINIQNQKEKLVEILQAEHDAKETIRRDLEDYRNNLFKIRDKNLKMKCSLSLLNHCHNITKPYVFSYVVHWPIESFARPLNQDKKKTPSKSKN